MRKSLTLIVILITLSLVGIILIQVSWIRSVLLVKQERVDEQLNNAMGDVAAELMEEAKDLPPWTSPLVISGLPKDQLMNFIQPSSSLATRYSMLSIQRRLRKSFEKYGHGKVAFEFAIISEANQMGYEMVSPGFDEAQSRARTDSMEHRIAYLLLYNPSESFSASARETLIVVLGGQQRSVWRSMGWMIAGALLFTMIIIAAFYVTVRTMLRQRRISQMKTDFINNMTHQLKTPLASLSLASDILLNERIITQPDQVRYYAGMIKTENQRLNTDVESILKSAQYGKAENTVVHKSVHLHALLERLPDHFGLRLQEMGGTLSLQLSASNDLVDGDAAELSILFDNLLDNAIKYKRENVPPEIRISSQNRDSRLQIRVEDNGMGMTRETRSHIFERFYRAHTGNRHDVKGFGLGLTHVRSIAEAHRAKISVESALGKGSTFIIDFPIGSKA